ncbi:MAG: D-inositol-3-phosphate glycosyltransferase [Solirubrobacteraceae bacterium]|jgi:glycosyltransferase involved in cell wall biosynthesis|nr:D-inositol-3-phosphate glycosyltransferase [Solirubrobacteraceae bacterium]
MTRPVRPAAPLAVVAPVHPLVSGAAQFNTAMVSALADLGPVTALSWRRLYPPVLHRRDAQDLRSRPTRVPRADTVLDWVDPRTWRTALRRIDASGARAMVLPWIHPVMAPPYRYLLRHRPTHVARVVVCHNVLPHEPVRCGRLLTRGVLGHADLLVVHASQQIEELASLGLGDRPVLRAFHPRFSASDLCALPDPITVRAERERQGNPDISLLAFGAIRPYKGIDLALEALARIEPAVRVRLTVAGVFWDGGEELRGRVRALGLEERVELRDGFVSNEEAALLFLAADASLLPYRSATQSGVVQLSFAYGTPVIATAVGGLPEAVQDGIDGILCPPGDAAALAAAISRLPGEASSLADGVRRAGRRESFARYAELVNAAVDGLPATQGAAAARTRSHRPVGHEVRDRPVGHEARA